MFKSTPAFIIAFIFLLVGIGMLAKRIKQQKNNTATTQATIIGYEEEESYDADTGTSIVYYPILRYQVNGVEYTNKGEYGSSGRKEDVGRIISINYNPNNPNEFNITKQIISWILPILVTIVGLALSLYMINW